MADVWDQAGYKNRTFRVREYKPVGPVGDESNNRDVPTAKLGRMHARPQWHNDAGLLVTGTCQSCGFMICGCAQRAAGFLKKGGVIENAPKARPRMSEGRTADPGTALTLQRPKFERLPIDGQTYDEYARANAGVDPNGRAYTLSQGTVEKASRSVADLVSQKANLRMEKAQLDAKSIYQNLLNSVPHDHFFRLLDAGKVTEMIAFKLFDAADKLEPYKHVHWKHGELESLLPNEHPAAKRCTCKLCGRRAFLETQLSGNVCANGTECGTSMRQRVLAGNA